MTAAELRELAGRAEKMAEREATYIASAPAKITATAIIDQINRLFLMARNLRERADELEKGDILEAFDK